MHIAPTPSGFPPLISWVVFTALLGSVSLSGAQTTPAATPATPPAATSAVTPVASTGQPASRNNQLIEHITIEDGGSRIDEQRFGGQTRSISVQPKGGMPAYDIQPETGVRTWKIFGY